MHEYLYSFQPDEDAASPEDVRIMSIEAVPQSDPQKIRVSIQLSPFKVPPDLNFRILDTDQNEISSVSMIETVLDEFNFVMHLRKNKNALAGQYELLADVFYRELGTTDSKTIVFAIS